MRHACGNHTLTLGKLIAGAPAAAMNEVLMDYPLSRGTVELGRIRLALSSHDADMVHGMLEVASNNALYVSADRLLTLRDQQA